jgi:hypothetical protein
METHFFPLRVIASPKGVAIRRSRCKGEARGNLRSSLASLGTGLRRFTPRNDKLPHALVLDEEKNA